MNQQAKLKLSDIDTSYQPFFYEATENDLLVSSNNWPTPAAFNADNQTVNYLLSKIIDEVFEAENIHLAKQTLYKRAKSIFKTIGLFNLVLNYLDSLNYLRIQNGGVSGRKKIVVLNPKVLEAFYK